MQSHSSIKQNHVRAPNGTRGKTFVFLSGVFVGLVVFPVIGANFYVGFSIQQAFLSEFQQENFDRPQGNGRQGHQKQQLRNEKWSSASSPTIRDETSVEILNKTNNENRITEVPNPTISSSTGTNETSSSRCDVEEPSFYELARETGTDKVKGVSYLPACLADDSTCTRPSCQREKCRPWGHFYHTMYQQQLSKFLDPNDSFQLLEIGYVRIQYYLYALKCSTVCIVTVARSCSETNFFLFIVY